MTLEELKNALLAADQSAVLVPPRLLARVIQQVHKLPSQFLGVPHHKSYLINRHLLFQHIEQDELNLDADRLLPPTVILLARPSAEKLHHLGRDAILLKYWRRLFHANVHRVLERRLAPDTLTQGEIRARIEQIGQIEFNEIRTVLQQEHFLFPGADDRAVYIEFAAVYLDLRFFLSNLRPIYFPAIRDFQRIDQILAQDVNAPALFHATRLEGAPEPVVRTDTSSDEPSQQYWKLIRKADRAAKAGNTVRAAILRTQAANVAPSALTPPTQNEASADLQRLTIRLQPALRLSDEETRDWLQCLAPLLEKTDQGDWTVEARLLYDLQKVCVDHERDIYALDLVEWALSAGNRPIKRPLPTQRLVRIPKHLRSAIRRLSMARIADASRQRLAQLLQNALHQSENRLQMRFRPVLTDALLDVGLQAQNPPEQTAFHKMVEELLDRITEYGFLTFSDLRDVISRNNLKLPDIDDPQEYVRGDPLLRLDRRLATALDGVYRPGEVYLRWLERLTSLSFGTKLGRFLTRYFALPFGGAVVILEGLQLLLSEFKSLHVPIFGPLSLLGDLIRPREDPVAPIFGIVSFVLLGLLLLGLMRVPPFRRRCKLLVVRSYRMARKALVEVPAQFLPLQAIRAVLRSWPFQLFYWYLFTPLLVSALIAWRFPQEVATAVSAGTLFLIVALVVNSRLGRAVGAALTRGLLRFADWLRAGLLQNLVQFIIRAFKQVTDLVETFLYTVDEWLRFKSGESRSSLAARAVLGILWFPVSYVARLYMVVLVEPGFNPLKAPISILAAKFVYPITLALGFTPAVTQLLSPLLGPYVAGAIAYSTWWLLPDAFGFLFWEMKENWSLYRANRAPQLRPVMIGHHGETMIQLLRPGFHSGTLPKLFARLRWAERTAYEAGSWQSARAARQSLADVEEALRLFLQRELLMLLHQSMNWPGQSLRVGRVGLASNRITAELVHAEFPDTPLRIAFEEQAGWLVAGIPDPGWLPRVDASAQRALARGLGGLYKLAGVDLVREHIQAQLPASITTYEITAGGLVLWLDPAHATRVIYNLHETEGLLRPVYPDGKVCEQLPPLEARRSIFARVPIPWSRWVESWQQETETTADLSVFGLLVGGQTGLEHAPKTDEALEPGNRVATGSPSATWPAGPGGGSGPLGLSAGNHVGAPAPLETDVAASAAAITRTRAPGQGVAIQATADPLFGSLPQTFGRYRVMQQLGEGGMGAVYLAVDTTLDRKVALKLSRAQAQGRAEETARFLREARAAAALQHEGICRVLDFGDIDGTHYLTMEYVEGRPLSQLMQAGQPLQQRWAADLLRRVALAVAEAHRQGVIHRDLKPANIMIDERGQPKVVDFGLARREQDITLTGHGIVMGTPAYMSPEQVSGRPVSPATDVYSLGVILYQMLTGRLPFQGTLTQLTYLIVHQEPEPPSNLRSDLDPRLETICRKAMAKDPVRRYGSMAELAGALEEYLQVAASG